MTNFEQVALVLPRHGAFLIVTRNKKYDAAKKLKKAMHVAERLASRTTTDGELLWETEGDADNSYHVLYAEVK